MNIEQKKYFFSNYSLNQNPYMLIISLILSIHVLMIAFYLQNLTIFIAHLAIKFPIYFALVNFILQMIENQSLMQRILQAKKNIKINKIKLKTIVSRF